MTKVSKVYRLGLVALLAGIVSAANAGPLDLANTPLYLTVGSVAPNLVVTLDTSSSMWAASVPDSADASHPNRWFKSAAGNAMYYNPATIYTAPYKYDGSQATTSFSIAYINGFNTGRGNVNLGTGYRPTRDYNPESSSQTLADHKSNDVQCCNNASTNSATCTTTGTKYCHINSGVGTATNKWIRMSTASTTCSAHTDCQTRTAPAYYYVFDSSNANCTATDKKDDDCYDIKIVSATSGPGGTDERQNFANWYSFYRTRTLALMSSADIAFWTLPADVRVAWQNLNTCNNFTGTGCTGLSTAKWPNYIKPFTGTHRDNFFKWVFDMDSASGTPLRVAAQRVGDYYSTAAGQVNSPYAENPQVSAGTEHSCRKNFHLLMTDGEWNTTGETGLATVGNKDGTSISSLPDTTPFTAPNTPFSDSYSNSLADVIFKYWATDLRTDLDNKVPPKYVDRSGDAAANYWNPRNDPASWQHVVTYTVGLGLTSQLTAPNPAWGGSTYAGDYSSLADGTKNWPSQSTTAGKIYDLWHGALNSRGEFFSAESPQDVTNAFSSILGAVVQGAGSAAGLASNSTSIQPTNTSVYQAKIDSSIWMGKLLLLPVQANGTVGNATWDAGMLIPAHNLRNIATFNGTAGVSFSACSSLSLAQQNALAMPDPKAADTKTAENDCNDRINWIRGDHSLEKLTTTSSNYFRKRYTENFIDESDFDTDGNRTETLQRSWVLGDIVNSDPAYAKDMDFGYGASSAMPEATTYDTFVTGKSSRVAAIFVGANDGMLHAFRADPSDAQSGKELFAYVPAGVYHNLSKLTDPNYTHTYYVDGSPTIGDAYLTWGTPATIDDAWRTVIVGGLNAGGKSVYALDITNPTSFSAGNVLWEYPTKPADIAAESADIGYTYSQPQIARLNNGQWAAIFGNGYNSTSELAYLYVVNLNDGSLIKKIPAGTMTSNGLSTPVKHDADGDKITDYVYAGDLQGNLWKFDLSSTDTNLWGVANAGNPIFVASNSKPTTHVQPITVKPQLGAHPDGGVMVYFGTGRYLTSSDTTDDRVQSFYGIWDKDGSTVVRSSLIEQTIEGESILGAYTVRSTSANTVDYGLGTVRGWFMDLTSPKTNTRSLERVLSTSLLKYERVIFTTAIPSTDPCEPGGTTWLMELDAMSGSRTPESVFDLNNDGSFTSADNVGGLPASGIKATNDVGIAKVPIWLDNPGTPGTAIKLLSGTGGGKPMSITNKAPTTTPSVRRVFWMQIQ